MGEPRQGLKIMTINVGVVADSRIKICQRAIVKIISDIYLRLNEPCAKAQVARKIFYEYIKKVDPDVIMMQELHDADVEAIMLIKDESGNAKYSSHKNEKTSKHEARIFLKKTRFNTIHFQNQQLSIQLPQPVTATQSVLDGYIAKIPERLTCVIAKANSGEEILFASWHGQYNGIDDENKIKTAEKMIKSVQQLADDKPFVIGGDFNLYYEKLIEHLDNLDESTVFPLSLGYSVADYSAPNINPSHSYSTKRNDYFVYNGLKIGIPSISNPWFGNYEIVSRDWRTIDNSERMSEINDDSNKKIIFDHDPVCCLFVKPSEPTLSLKTYWRVTEKRRSGPNGIEQCSKIQRSLQYPKQIARTGGHHVEIREDHHYGRREQQSDSTSPPEEGNSSTPESYPNIEEVTKKLKSASLNPNNNE